MAWTEVTSSGTSWTEVVKDRAGWFEPPGWFCSWFGRVWGEVTLGSTTTWTEV